MGQDQVAKGVDRHDEVVALLGPAAVGRQRQARIEPEPVEKRLRGQEGATTRDCISYFTPFLRDPASKDAFSQLVKEIASLQKGVLTLRKVWRQGGPGKKASSSPAPAPAGSSQAMDTSA